MKVVIAGGGTAGHVNPAIAVAHSLRASADVTFVGTQAGAESRLVPAAGFPLEFVEVRGFDRARPLSIVPTGVRAAGAVVSARRTLGRERPDVTLGMGGYVSLPVCTAAKLLGVPVVIHEQNIVLGLANRVVKPFARAVAVSFQETLRRAGRKAVFTGNPVLPHIVDADMEAERAQGLERFELDARRKTLLVFGGSQGAARINDAAQELARLWTQRSDVQILHVTGGTQVAASSSGRLIYRVVPRIERMVEAYALADLALCRGGATTVSELAVTGVPAIIVPYPYHRDHQQERHARVLEAEGAARVLLDHEATGHKVGDVAAELLDDAESLGKMRAAALAFARPDAAERLASVVAGACR
jgi:UDP-N-acetylglucosamine--N-acetylmuramyl-(pentapeptide) pyrophosphoryl-undecaprenol N-acetylglucosamine transferase